MSINPENITPITPLGAPLTGATRVPGDKSISHRAVLFAAMAEGTSNLQGVLDSADVRSSMAAVSALGAKVHMEKQPDGSFAGSITGWGAQGPKQPAETIDCGNSGTTTRLLMGILSPWNIMVELTGDSSLVRRPMRRITGPLSLMGAQFAPEGKDTLPLSVCGGSGLHGIDFESPVASAQLKTALLLAGVYAQGTTTVHEPAPSRNHTELMLPAFGVEVSHHDCFAQVEGGQHLVAADVTVPGDPSSAAFMACAAALCPGSDIVIENVALGEARIGFVRALAAMGVSIAAENLSAPGLEPAGTIAVRYCDSLHAAEIPAREIASLVDEIPVLALVAARAAGVTVFREVSELRVKETNRLQAIIDGLSQLGIRAWEDGDDLCIQGDPTATVPEGLVFDSLGDHRLAMTWALVALCGSVSVSVHDFGACAVSYPQFLEDIRKLVA